LLGITISSFPNVRLSPPVFYVTISLSNYDATTTGSGASGTISLPKYYVKTVWKASDVSKSALDILISLITTVIKFCWHSAKKSSIALKVVVAQIDLGKPNIPVDMPGIAIVPHPNSLASLSTFLTV
jgi:flavin reductase (DIM6/NTAB) family NADH-FMN oxidoreductase RutF